MSIFRGCPEDRGCPGGGWQGQAGHLQHGPIQGQVKYSCRYRFSTPACTGTVLLQVQVQYSCGYKYSTPAGTGTLVQYSYIYRHSTPTGTGIVLT